MSEMVRQLRDGRGRNGLVLANGGNLTYQYVVCFSTEPPQYEGYPGRNPLPGLVTKRGPPVDEVAEGEATIEVSSFDYPTALLNSPRLFEMLKRRLDVHS
jgi:hypothetical protein